jgi:hypothetical protein
MNDHQYGLGQFIRGRHGWWVAKLKAGFSHKHFAPGVLMADPLPLWETAGYFDGTPEAVFLNTKKCLFDKRRHTIIIDIVLPRIVGFARLARPQPHAPHHLPNPHRQHLAARFFRDVFKSHRLEN